MRVMTKPNILVEQLSGKCGHVLYYTDHKTRALVAMPLKRNTTKGKANPACKHFTTADSAYHNFDDVQRRFWRDAVKRTRTSAYDVWMKETLPWLNRGMPGPVLPSQSGGFQSALSRPGHWPLPDVRTNPLPLYTQRGRIRLWLAPFGEEGGTAAIVETNFKDHTGAPFTLPVRLEAYIPGILDPVYTTTWPEFGNHERKVAVLSDYEFPTWSDFKIRTSVIFACVEAIENHDTTRLFQHPELPPFGDQPADLRFPHFPEQNAAPALALLPAEQNIPLGIPPGPEPVITCRALVSYWRHHAHHITGNRKLHRFHGGFLWMVKPSHATRRTKVCFRLNMVNVPGHKSRWYQVPIHPLPFRIGRRASYHWKWDSYPNRHGADWTITITAHKYAQLWLRLGFRYGNFIETWLPFAPDIHQIKLPVLQ